MIQFTICPHAVDLTIRRCAICDEDKYQLKQPSYRGYESAIIGGILGGAIGLLIALLQLSC